MKNLIAERLRELGKTQTWLAERTGMKVAYINRLCRHEFNSPSVRTAIRIGRALVTPVELLWPDATDEKVKSAKERPARRKRNTT